MILMWSLTLLSTFIIQFKITEFILTTKKKYNVKVECQARSSIYPKDHYNCGHIAEELQPVT